MLIGQTSCCRFRLLFYCEIYYYYKSSPSLFLLLYQTEHNLKKEKDAKAKLDKEKRKVEGDLKDTRDQLVETENELKNSQDTVSK